MIPTEAFDKVEAASPQDLNDWLAAHHAQADSVWLVTWKKHAGARYLSREAVLDALLAWGWIDGIRRVLDDDRTMQLISPRAQNVWTQTYRDRAGRLIAEGAMQPPGFAAIAAARAAGTWEGLQDVDALVAPPDLLDALDAAASRDAYDRLPPAYRRNVLRWIAIAKRDATRADRIAKTVASVQSGTRMPNF